MYGNIEALKASPKCQERFPGRFSMVDTLWTCPKSHVDGQNHKNTSFRRAIFHKRPSRRARPSIDGPLGHTATILQHMIFQRQWRNYVMLYLWTNSQFLCLHYVYFYCVIVLINNYHWSCHESDAPPPPPWSATHPPTVSSFLPGKEGGKKILPPKNSEERSGKLNQKRKLRRVDPLCWERVKAAQETREHHLHSNVRYLLSKLPGLVRREGGGEAWGKKLSDDAISLLFSTIKSDRSCNSPSFDTNLTENQVEKWSK